MVKTVSILGATGSIGSSTIDVLEHNPNRFKVAALVGGQNVEAMVSIAKRLRPECVAMYSLSALQHLKTELKGIVPMIGVGEEFIKTVAVKVPNDIMISAITGIAGLAPTYESFEATKILAIANKETLVACGSAVMRAAKQKGIKLLPIDSEHNALYQALGSGHIKDVQSMTLTASGGPFRKWTKQQLEEANADAARKHPIWSMGDKINIDSATLMNKGLEVIEAHYLFDLGWERIQVIVHPESIIHGLVHWNDGSVTAGLAQPDMRIPIRFCLGVTERLSVEGKQSLNLVDYTALTFEKADTNRFPCLRLAYAALKSGGAAPCILNAANEVAVQAYLEGNLRFYGISHLVEEALETFSVRYGSEPGGVEESLSIDAEVKAWCKKRFERQHAFSV